MGRSKFPGKPSKSINRKRISVLQLDPNNSSTVGTAVGETSGQPPPPPASAPGSTTAAASTPQQNTNSSSASPTSSSSSSSSSSNSSSSSSSPSSGAATAAGATNNSEDEEATQTKTEEENSSALEGDKHKNGKREDDDDDDEPPTTATGGGGGGGGSGLVNARQSNGQRPTSNANNSTTPHQQTNHNNNSQQNSLNSKVPGPSLTAKVLITTATTTTNCSKQQKRLNLNKTDNKNDKTLTGELLAPHISESMLSNERVEFEKDASEDLEKKDKSKKSATAASLSQPKFAQRNCKKFKNLNINKPEVMLPSSTKLKLQQKQQQQQQQQTETTPASQTQQQDAPTATAATATTVSNTHELGTAAEHVKNLPQQQMNQKQKQQQQHTAEICEMSSSSSSSAATPTNAAAVPTASLSETSSTTASTTALTICRKQQTPTNDDNDGTTTHKTGLQYHNNSNSNSDSGSITSNQQQHNDDHVDDNHNKRVIVPPTDTATHDNNIAAVNVKEANTVAVVDHHNHHDDDDGDGDDDDDVVENSSSHNDLKSPRLCEKSSAPEDSTLINGTSELPHSEIPAGDECKSRLKQNPSSATATTTTLAMETTSTLSNGQTNTCAASSSNSDKKQKKTVTFKNVLETSDDKSAVKKFYNPDNRKPLISIIKKECLNRPLMYTRSSECIVRPSRLTEILKNNSNIDKLNALKFRSSNCGSIIGNSNLSDRADASSVLAGPLSRVFGAPLEDEGQQQKQNLINFRLTKTAVSDDDEEDGDEDDDEAEEEEEDDDEEDEDEEEDDDEDEDEDLADEEKVVVGKTNGEGKTLEEADACMTNGGSGGELSNVIKTNDKHLAEGKAEDDQQMIIDKHFVLPKRSCRSSRVIKPNKRLLEDGTICKKSSLKPTPLNNTSSTMMSSSSAAIKEEKSPGVTFQTNYFGLGDFKGKDCNGLTASKSSKDSSSLDAAKPSAFAAATSNVFSNFGLNSASGGSSTNSLLTTKPSSFILRQPRLQFESLSANPINNASAINTSERSNATVTAAAAAALALSASLPKSLLQAISSSTSAASTNSGVNLNTTLPASCSPSTTSSTVTVPSLLSPTFSLNGSSTLKNNVNATPTSTLSPSSTVCVVCSTTIHTKNWPQASKYGQLSCEYCRKFISKIAKKSLAIKNSTTNKPIIAQCKADGNCTILPLNKGIHIKNFKKLYKERCGLCWLKKCLQTLQLPKVRLNALIPVLNAVIGPKSNVMESKIRKDLDLLEATKLSIKWKPSSSSTTSVESLPSSLSSPLLTGDGGIKLNLKTNSLAENNATFGSTPLLRPAILEKQSYVKTPAVETKLEITEKVDKKPLEILKDVKVEAVTTEVPTSKPKRKDKSLEKERKEIKLKDLSSPKCEEKVIEKSEIMETEPAEQQMQGTTSLITSCSNTVSTTTPTPAATATATSSAVGAAASATTGSASADKRQRIDLKGPRVKHVCRSASIVLGQPLAMFGEDEEDSALTAEELQQSLEIGAEKLPLTDENDNCASCKTQQQAPTVDETGVLEPPPPKAAKVENVSSTKGILPPSKLSQRPHHYNTQLTAYKKQFSSQMVATASSALIPQRRKEPQMKCKLLISIDFWENYDPAEVCQTGFGLIITETVAQRALCFLCGSAGQEPLIFCACCCEPYHQYCVQDEFNLKHGSLDDTLLLNDSCLSITGLTSNSNTAIAKLNWLCPRCTVCYTCNMSSGAKVKCQKCQKNYHSTCLGTSKRLLGADRPLICVNCLKCRSCSTTKVTKFVGNLPMCTNCFKLRKKGNYCPVCQKCYDDQDFDLKMMECGDCHQWVHAKCETLTDEQYNLLSTLPESIEFICKRCSRKSSDAKQRASEWRDAVKEEFKSNLMSVLKLLSKSRQACSLLRLSPRKQMKCSCGSAGATPSTTKYQPKSLQFNQDQSTQSLNIDVYEFDDHDKDAEITAQPLALEKKCTCQSATNAPSNHLSLVEIKQKISNGSYGSLAEFNYDMTVVIQMANCDELVIVYKEILSEQFPWFQNETQACTDALEEDMYEASGGAYGLNTSLESESDYQMDCLPSSGEHQEEAERSALLAELPPDLDDLVYNIRKRQDSRICLFCRRTGEGLPNEEARLLYCGHDCWVHTNCALWSAEVFEEIDGSLQNVHSAVSRGRMIKCSVCGNRGATVGCNVKSCGEHYHYPCARSKNCAFLADKSMYCPNHAPSPNSSKVSFETQFDVMRPVYVELERKRKKLVEPTKVQFHIGSLEVKQLGHVLPRFSDTYEAVVPVNFLCSRLYWSSKEPWKIVEYTVRTYIHNSSNSSLSGAYVDLGKNFTVDHTQSNSSLIQMGLSQIQQWHTSLAKGEYDAMEEYDYLNNFPQNSSCSGGGTQETSGTGDEEPQTNADLLPPEIKDAIFEDLPGDLLEGISMLDIFTKCMNYEDMTQGEQSQTPLTDEDTMTSIGAFTKQLTAELNNGWPNTASASVVEDALLSTTQAVKLQKLKKSSSPVINCEGAKNAIKRRKISENMLISLNQQHQRSQKKDCSTVPRRLDLETTTKRTFTWSAEKRYNAEASTTQTDAKMRIMQVDGVDDTITEYRFITQDAAHATAIKCERCQCTYRNIEAFQRHMPTCEPMSSSTSESDTDNNAHAPEITTQGITLEQLQELNNKLQQQQQQQHQRTTQIPFLQAIPTQTLSQLQGLQAANIQTLPLQLQGVQNLQNLQNLQQLQQLTQPQAALGGNFFISAAQPEVSNATPDLQLYANALQGLTANLNGTFTLQPTANTFTTTQQMTQNQPQLLAVSTNADGTQQIIQLPAQNSAPAPTYQTLQATNSDKKIILPVGGGKPMKTMATKAAQQAAAKNKLKATTAVKPIQSKINVTPATQMPAPQTVNAHLLNQQLLQQLQQAQQQTTNAPQIVFQQPAPAPQQPQIIMQQPQNIISFVTTSNDGTQQPQLQYVTLPTAQAAHDYKPQTQASTLFTTANTQPMMQSTYLQTDASGNLVLTNGPPQTTTPLQLLTAQQTPQVIGTLIQPQTLQLQGGNVITTSGDGGLPQSGTTQTQQQVIFSGGAGAAPNGLEMLTAAAGTPQVILATSTPPMYYGLETIVQNTVMSSQQFVSTAMPGVLSQNASFSATTTQVFQASKIEPLVDIPAGYVLLNNVDANNTAAMLQPQQQATPAQTPNAAQANQANFIQAALQQQAAAAALSEQQQQHQQQQPQTPNNVYRIQTPPVSTAQGFHLQPQIVVTQTQTAQQQQQQPPPVSTAQHTTQFVDANTGTVYSAKVTPVAQVKRNKAATVTKVQPQVVNKVMPNVAQVTVQQQSPTVQQAKLKPPAQVIQAPGKPNIQVTAATINNTQPQIVLTGNQAQTVLAAPMKPQAPVEAATLAATPVVAVNKKTNMIRPLNKAEVKPKVMKTATATVVTKPSSGTPVVAHNNTSINNNSTNSQMPNNTNKMIVLKPQLQQQQNQLPQQSMAPEIETRLSQPEANAGAEHDSLIAMNNLADNNLNQEFMNLQHVANSHHQHYNVADALLLDENSEMASQQPLSHCSYSNTTTASNFETSQQTQHQQQQVQVVNENVSNILPTIQRMPQYTNINIVNPLQQYSTANTLTTTNSTVANTTVTRPTNRVLPMQQKTYEQHTTTCSTNSSLTSTTTSTFCSSTTTITSANSQISTHNTTTTVASEEASTMIKTNINKIAYEAEVKQMLLHSPNPQHDAQQVTQQQHTRLQQQQQHVMHMQQTLIHHKSSPPSLTYEINEKPEDGPKLCYVSQQMQPYVENSTTAVAEECLITDPKFPPEGEVILGTEACCENDEEALVSATAEDNNNNGDDDEEDDDGFSLKMPSANCSDNLSMDSDEPAVKEKISKILDNLTNEDCTDSLNTNTTLEAHADVNCNAVSSVGSYMQNSPNTVQNSEQQQLPNSESGEYYATSPEDTTALIAAQLVVENMQEKLQEKLQAEVPYPLANEYLHNCQNAVMPPQIEEHNVQEHQRNSNLSPSAPFHPPSSIPPAPMRHPPKRVSGPHLLYEIQSEDGFTYKSTSIAEVWEKVFEAVQVARRANGLAPLPEGPLADMSGVQMIGLKTNALKYLIEQLPGVEKCSKYTPKYHKRNTYASQSHAGITSASSTSMSSSTMTSASLDTDGNSIDYISDQEELIENPYDCARCEPYSKRSEYDMFSWLASRHRKQPVQVFVQPSDNELVPRRGTGSNLPMAMKYRTLKETYKDYVGVFRSHIHGRGLYCTKDIEAGEMVIEYAGELIRSTLTDQRERYYNSRGIGCYMFKIDDHLVVDATMRGNAARFINHSCEPNCYSKVVDILGHKHIIIFALRRIVQGEELTYDYKFPFEDEKIPCSCGSKKCRKYLN